jgi:thiol-disulfide isomerase/thioredoxin
MRYAIICGSLFLLACAAPVRSFDDTNDPPPDAGKKPVTDTDSGAVDPGSDMDAGEVDSGPPPCMYPQGNYGKSQGMVIPQNLTWQGYAPGQSSVSTLSANDLYDCDGRYGINAILFDTSALWCGACQQEASALPQFMQTWGPQGVKVITLVIQDSVQQPATTATAQQWRNAFNLTQDWVVADPGFSFAHSGQNGLPMNVLVDPRTMQIVKVVEGYGGMDPAVSQLALKNKM